MTTATARTVLFWGAGATASLGFRVTDEQSAFLRRLAPRPDRPEPLEDRVRSALGDVPARWRFALRDLLAVLGDDGWQADHRTPLAEVLRLQLAAMARSLPHADAKQRRARIAELRSLYDWPALVAAINVCPIPPTARADNVDPSFDLRDLFNLLDMHQQSGHGFPARDRAFLAPQRVLAARNVLGLLLQAVVYIDWHTCRRRRDQLRELHHHQDFAEALSHRLQGQGVRLAATMPPADLEKSDFVLADIGFVSLNWDPVGLWSQFLANRSRNRRADAPRVGTPRSTLQLYHDLGHVVAGPRVDKPHLGSPVWQPMNESSARQLNDPTHDAAIRVRVAKYLFPHGCLWWRECPNCGKLSSYIGDRWEIDSATLLPPPPLERFSRGMGFKNWGRDADEKRAWERGEVDAHVPASTAAPLHTRTTRPSSRKPASRPDRPPFWTKSSATCASSWPKRTTSFSWVTPFPQTTLPTAPSSPPVSDVATAHPSTAASSTWYRVIQNAGCRPPASPPDTISLTP